jgi:tRNA G26 N,N-dimethylase Trm1
VNKHKQIARYDVQLIPVVVAAVDLYTRVMISAHNDLQRLRNSMKVNAHLHTSDDLKISTVKVFPLHGRCRHVDVR